MKEKINGNSKEKNTYKFKSELILTFQILLKGHLFMSTVDIKRLW